MKKNIVLLHGWGAGTKRLEPLKKSLQEKGWNVFLPRLPGFDLAAPNSVWGVGDYADFVWEKARGEFGKEFFVFGHSFGGRVAIKLGAAGLLSGVILCSTSGLSRANALKRTIFWLLAKFGKVLLLVPPLGKFWRKVLYKGAREHDYEKSEGIMKEVFKKVVAEDLRPLVLRIRVQTLILWGKEDRTTPVKDAYFIKRNLPKSKLVIFPNDGHRLPYDSAEQVAAQIEEWYKTLH